MISYYFHPLMKYILSIVVLLSCTVLHGQDAKYRFSFGCDFEGIFDSTKITRIELDNCLTLLWPGSSRLVDDAVILDLKDTIKLNVDSLDKDFNTEYSHLKNLDIAKSAFWQTYRQKELIALKDLYKLVRITSQAYQNPCILNQYKAKDSSIAKYQAALCKGGATSLTVWKEMEEEHCKKNGDPNRCFQEFLEMYNSPDRLLYAKLEVISFGWWNSCLNYLHSPDNPTSDDYFKLFKKVETIGNCDDTD
jgi:hypothetical protein